MKIVFLIQDDESRFRIATLPEDRLNDLATRIYRDGKPAHSRIKALTDLLINEFFVSCKNGASADKLSLLGDGYHGASVCCMAIDFEKALEAVQYMTDGGFVESPTFRFKNTSLDEWTGADVVRIKEWLATVHQDASVETAPRVSRMKS